MKKISLILIAQLFVFSHLFSQVRTVNSDYVYTGRNCDNMDKYVYTMGKYPVIYIFDEFENTIEERGEHADEKTISIEILDVKKVRNIKLPELAKQEIPLDDSFNKDKLGDGKAYYYKRTYTTYEEAMDVLLENSTTESFKATWIIPDNYDIIMHKMKENKNCKENFRIHFSEKLIDKD